MENFLYISPITRTIFHLSTYYVLTYGKQVFYSALDAQVKKVARLHEKDLEQGYGDVYLPHALAKKYPAASEEFRWQYLFPGKNLGRDPRGNKVRRHHVLESGLQKAVKTAANRAGLTKRVGCHTLRHSFATHLLEGGVNIRVVQELMGHADVKTTEIYTHVMEKNIIIARAGKPCLDLTPHRGAKKRKPRLKG